MTLDEIEESLPQGLHDSEIQRLTYDIGGKSLTLDLSVYVVGPDDQYGDGEASHRDSRLIFDQTLYFTLDPPIELLNDQLHILSFEANLLTETGSPAQLPSDTYLFKLFTQYRVLQIAAAQVRFEWAS